MRLAMSGLLEESSILHSHPAQEQPHLPPQDRETEKEGKREIERERERERETERDHIRVISV